MPLPHPTPERRLGDATPGNLKIIEDECYDWVASIVWIAWIFWIAQMAWIATHAPGAVTLSGVGWKFAPGGAMELYDDEYLG